MPDMMLLISFFDESALCFRDNISNCRKNSMARSGNEEFFTDLYRLTPFCTSTGGLKTTGENRKGVSGASQRKIMENEAVGNTDHRSAGTV